MARNLFYVAALALCVSACSASKSTVKPMNLSEEEASELEARCDDEDASACMKMGKAYARRDGLKARKRAREFYDAACKLGSRTGCLLREVANPVTKEMLGELDDKLIQYQKYCLGGEDDYCGYLAYYIYDSDASANETLVMRRAMAVSCVKDNYEDCYYLARALDRGYGDLERDPHAAFLISEWSCQTSSDPSSCHFVGLSYEIGEAVERDLGRACEFYVQSCDDGYYHGCGNASIVFDKGECTPRDEPDYEKALEYAQEGCREDKGNGCDMVGQLYQRGSGVLKSYQTALEYYHRGCELEDGDACVKAGELLDERDVEMLEEIQSETGISAPEYYRKAEKYMQQDCEKALLGTACDSLADLYEAHEMNRRSRYSVKLLRKRACRLDIRFCDEAEASPDEVEGTL
ncbi:MAG: tetratricopeptide repeat protein [Myxococcota bacterium]